MYIDESLSKGLRTAFWKFLESENGRLKAKLDVFLTKTHDLTSQKSAAKAFAALNKVADSPTLLHREITDSKKRAAWWAINLNSDPDHEFGAWNERVLRFDIYRWWAGTGMWQPTWLTTLIGEHCIARMFQRMKWDSVPKSHDLIPELKELALLVNWYNIANDLIAQNHNGLRLSLFIPTSNGAFFGVINPNDKGLNELRTFVGIHQFTEDQRRLWDSLRRINKDPLLNIHLGHTLDPSGLDKSRTADEWLTPVIEIIKLLLDNAHLLQNEIVQLHPSLVMKIVE